LGAVAAVLGRNSEACKLLTQRMLRALSHRGPESAIAVLHNRSLHGAIGVRSHQNAKWRFLQSSASTVSVDGSFYQVADKNQARSVCRILSKHRSLSKAAGRLLRMPGSYSIIFSVNGYLGALRDTNGLKPLYYGRTRNLTAFASERKALWSIGFRDVERVLPGHIYSATKKGVAKKCLARLPPSSETRMTLQQASSRLLRLLRQSVRRITEGVDTIGVAFSGGLDSAVTAVLAKDAHRDVQLISVGLPGSSELSTAEDYARQVGLPVEFQPFSSDTLEQYVRRVVWLIEEPNLMKVSVAIPLHWSATVASRLRIRVMLCGQGSDELYGGYSRYSRILDSKGRRALVDELYRTVIESFKVNYERDEQATAPCGVELRTAFADRDVVQFSLRIPLEFKVRPGHDLTRKWVLREAAKRLGLPENIIWRRKKAIQHGTGVENAIRKLAKKQNLTAEAYLEKTYADVRSLTSMP